MEWRGQAGNYDCRNRLIQAGDTKYTYDSENHRIGVVTDTNGLYYMRARYYNVDIKRFINQDVIVGSVENSPSLNRYAYVEGNPVNYLDPFGLEKWDNEFTAWHEGFSNVSYAMAISTILFPPAIVITKVSGWGVAATDIELHLFELIYCPAGSGYKYKLEHIGWIIVDLFAFTPAGDFVTVEFFIADKITQEQYGKGYFEYEIDELIKAYEYFVNSLEALNYLFKNEDMINGGN